MSTYFKNLALGLLLLSLLAAIPVQAEKEDVESDRPDDVYAGLKPRLIGPALMSGRVGDFAVDPANPDHYFVAVCSGGVWRTLNGGTTWTPVFDSEGSFSIGCVTLDPRNPSVVWVGTGENNSQRSVSFGDGVYRSRDGGEHWENLGLKESEHIGKILVDPHDSNIVYVAAQGPLWRSGGDRGLYKTTDGGATWQRILHISDETGINEVHVDPRDSRVLYASAYQRRRHVWTLIDGGPESAIYKSTDAGVTWRKLEHGLPSVDMGRIGVAISPANPDVVYAIIEAADGEGGVFRSMDRGETWSKRSKYMTTSPQYYNELVCDPVEVERVYALDTFLQVTEDGGASFHQVPGEHRHVDDHALWINPGNNKHLLVGCDGGIYESRDRGENWVFKPNLPVTQFYRVSVDNSTPFYFVYGGTQDNNSVGGPSRTTSRAGITNEDWFVTVGGDGYETQVDPEDPQIVYAMWQYGGLVRHDRRSGETIDIKPREKPGDEPYRWNWDSPLLLSPHAPQRLYFGGNRLFRTDDRGNSWTAISGDLTRKLDRNQLKVMGKIQNVDAVAKSDSTSIFGNLVSLDESPLVEGLIYVGTDDGLIQVTEDGGANWRKISLFPEVPNMAYVSCVTASRHDANTVFASFDHHKNGDFKPYVLKSTDRGVNWQSIAGDLPEREIIYSLKEDHVDPKLLFVGTEFGAYFSQDGGEHWIRIKGLPTIAVRDIEIQRRENDLLLGTFGRSIYILDDYSPLRAEHRALLDRDAAIFPVKDALRYIPTNRLGGSSGRGTQGASYYAAENPPYGAVFTYCLKQKLQTRKERRKEAEKEAKDKEPPSYPTIDQLRAEDEELEPQVMLIVRDESGAIVQRVPGSREMGIHRVAWNLRYPTSTPTRLAPPDAKDLPPWVEPPRGPLALPGTYTVTLAKQVDGVTSSLTDPVQFRVVPLEVATFAAEDRDAVLRFQRKLARLQRAVLGAIEATGEAQNRLDHIRKAIVDTPSAEPELLEQAQQIHARLQALSTLLSGDRTRSKRNESTLPSISERVENAVSSQWMATSAPTQTERDAYQYAGTEFAKALAELRDVMEKLVALESQIEAAGAPWTPGRIPTWELEE